MSPAFKQSGELIVDPTPRGLTLFHQPDQVPISLVGFKRLAEEEGAEAEKAGAGATEEIRTPSGAFVSSALGGKDGGEDLLVAHRGFEPLLPP
jgi:hypothetical protein